MLSSSLQFNHLLINGDDNQWNAIRIAINNPYHECIRVPKNIITPIRVTMTDYIELCEYYKKRLVFTTDPINVSAEYIDSPITIHGFVKSMSQIIPGIYQYNYNCPDCHKNITKKGIPTITTDLEVEIGCPSASCQIGNKTMLKGTPVLYDCVKVILNHNQRDLQAYLIALPKNGFNEIVQKLKIAIELGALVNFHGFTQPINLSGNLGFIFHIVDLDLFNVTDHYNHFLAFHFHTIPKNEKQAVMSIFFANLEFMRSYLRFDTYELQERYPDLVLYTDHNKQIVEFEFDVANYYLHKHHLEAQTTDMVIAWQNTSNRTDHQFTILLLQELQDMIVSPGIEAPIFQYTDIYPKFIDLIQFCFPHRHEKIYPLIAIEYLQITRLKGVYQTDVLDLYFANPTTKDEQSYATLVKILGPSDNNTIRIHWTKNPPKKKTGHCLIQIDAPVVKSYDTILHGLENIDVLQTFLSRQRAYRNKLSPLPVAKGTIPQLYTLCNDIDLVNAILIISQIFASIFGDTEITYDRSLQVFQLLKSQ